MPAGTSKAGVWVQLQKEEEEMMGTDVPAAADSSLLLLHHKEEVEDYLYCPAAILILQLQQTPIQE